MTTPQPTPRDVEQATRMVDVHEDDRSEWWNVNITHPTKCSRIDAGIGFTKQGAEHVAEVVRGFIAAALAQRDAEWREKCKAFLDESGEPRKVLGTLPVTADGCIVGDGGLVWPRADLYVFQNDGRPSGAEPWTPDEEAATAIYCLKENCTGDTIAPEEWHADKVYSCHEAAAEAARKEGSKRE